MTQMIENYEVFETVGGVQIGSGMHASIWSEKAIKIYSSALCRPAKGDVGEVAAAFYMLACGDELRYKQSTEETDSSKKLTQLSVSLEAWIQRLLQRKKGDSPATISSKGGNAKARVNFIQVCRNYLRHSLKELQDSQILKHWYLGARASYAYASCAAYDLVVPVQYTCNDTVHYCPMLVSVKNRCLYSRTERNAAVDAMQKVFTDAKVKTGVCILLLIGLEDSSQESESSQQPSLQSRRSMRKNRSSQKSSWFIFKPDTVSSMEIVVPADDDFGATNLALCSTCGGGEKSEVMVSHADLALGANTKFSRLLRHKTTEKDPSNLLLTDIVDGYNIALDEKSREE